nr:sugar kinase [Agrococcus sp. KRD186]
MSAVPRAGGVVTFGETMGLFVSADPGPLVHAGTVHLGIGGAESNVAIALQRLGVSTTWLGRRGNDSVGDLVERELRAEGLDVFAIRDSAQTGLMIKERRTSSVSRIWYYRAGSAGSRLAPGDIPEGLIERSALLHITGITPALSETARDATFEAVSRANTAGVPVSFDINFRSRLWSQDDARETLVALAAASDVVFAGDEEARIIVDGTGEVELAHAIRKLGPRQVLIKLGARGCFAVIDDEEFAFAAVPANVVDTVGAGDAFVAGYLAELLAGREPRSRLVTAVRSGAFACETAGDWEGMPFREELALLGASEPVVR